MLVCVLCGVCEPWWWRRRCCLVELLFTLETIPCVVLICALFHIGRLGVQYSKWMISSLFLYMYDLFSAKIGWIWGGGGRRGKKSGQLENMLWRCLRTCLCACVRVLQRTIQCANTGNIGIWTFGSTFCSKAFSSLLSPPFIHLMSSVHFPIWIKGKLCIFETSREKDRKLERKRNKERGWKWKRKRERKRQNNQISTLNGKWEIAFLTHSVLVKFTAFAVELMNEDNEDNAQNEMRFYSDEEKKENKYWKTIILHGIYEYKRTKDKMKCAAVKGRRQLLPLSQWMELYSLYV